MATFAIVEHSDVLEQNGAALFARTVPRPIHALALEQAKETLGDEIVVTFTGISHQALNTVFGEPISEVVAGVLPATIDWWTRGPAGWRASTAVRKASTTNRQLI